MPKTVDYSPPYTHQELAQALAAQVPASVVASFVDAMCHGSTGSWNTNRIVIEPRTILTQVPNQAVVDHHLRYNSTVLEDHGFTCATLIALQLILSGALPRNVSPEIQTAAADADQVFAAQIIRVWAATGEIPKVLLELSRIAELLKEEFWLMEKHEVEKMLNSETGNELTQLDLEFAHRPARITRFEKAGAPPILHIEIHTSKSAFNGDHQRYHAYIRQLAFQAGFTTQAGVVLVQNYFGRSGKDLKRTDIQLGIMGCYDSVPSLASLAAPLSTLFHQVTTLFANHGFDSFHPSSRNMLTLVVPTANATQRFVDRADIDAQSPMQTAIRYNALASTVGLIANQLGYVALPPTHVGTPEVLIANN
ncbi:hypothetical protein KA012_02715 [Candidatus Woesebacteria bacterium]|nr:hypothetical protein [Candidatus Woesebacteria bacterium]